MREFASSRSRAADLPLAARLLYTVFAGLILLGMLSSVVIYDDIVAFGAHDTPSDLHQRLVDHYRGEPSCGAAPAGRAAPIGYRKLLETTHAHLFVMALLLLVAGHLFLLSSASPRAKVGLCAVASMATVLHLLVPWILFTAGGGQARGLLYPITGGALLLSLTALLVVPVWEMWSRRSDAPRAPSD